MGPDFSFLVKKNTTYIVPDWLVVVTRGQPGVEVPAGVLGMSKDHSLLQAASDENLQHT